MIDTLVVCGKWPFRPLKFDWFELVEKMDENDVERAMVVNVNGAFYRDVHEANLELMEEMDGLPSGIRERFIIMGIVNPIYPGWEEDLKFLVESNVRIIAIFPNYHGYSLSDPKLSEFWEKVVELDLPLSLIAKFEDSRQRHRLDADEVEDNEVINLIRSHRNLKLILHNFHYLSALSIHLSNPDHEYLFFDVNFFYDVPIGDPMKFLEIAGEDRIVFSSFYPFRYYKVGVMKLEEANLLRSKNFERKLREVLR